MPEQKKDEILSLNVKKLSILHLVWKRNGVLKYWSFNFYFATNSYTYLKIQFI